MKKIMYVIAAAVVLLATGCKKEKFDPTKPTISWESNAGFSQVEMTASLDANITILAPGKIQDLKLVLNLAAKNNLVNNNNLVNRYIKIQGNKSVNGSNPVMDLVEDDKSASFLDELGMRVGRSLRGSEEVKLDLKKLLESILLEQPVENNSIFTIEIRASDQSGNSVSKTAKFHFTAAPEISWAKNEKFIEVDLLAPEIECKVEVWAPGKIDKMTVTLQEGAASSLISFVKNRTTGGTTVIDLINDGKVNGKDNNNDPTFKNWFPSGDAVSGKEKVVLDFGFMFQMKYDLESSNNSFVVYVEDKNGKQTVQTVKFKKI